MLMFSIDNLYHVQFPSLACQHLLNTKRFDTFETSTLTMTVVEVHPGRGMNVCIKLEEKSGEHRSRTSSWIHEHQQNSKKNSGLAS